LELAVESRGTEVEESKKCGSKSLKIKRMPVLQRDCQQRVVKKTERRMLRAIAVFKLAKAALLIGVGVAALRLVHTDIVGILEEWVPRIGFGPGSRYIGRLAVEAAALTPNRIKDVGVGSFIYAALFLTEGIGLWLLKRWAEWMTIVITSSLVPVEVWEIIRHPNISKVVLLLVNLALVGYLIYQVRKETQT
jgi:uncharacterized membrane protein (DUF2068 family)